jgi:two-component system, cell cycle response regulator DivK
VHQQNARRNRILVVEDNPLSLTLSKQLLKAHGYEILGTPEGLQALDLAREEQPDGHQIARHQRARSDPAA